jgi:hypothetical protein
LDVLVVIRDLLVFEDLYDFISKSCLFYTGAYLWGVLAFVEVVEMGLFNVKEL